VRSAIRRESLVLLAAATSASVIVANANVDDHDESKLFDAADEHQYKLLRFNYKVAKNMKCLETADSRINENNEECVGSGVISQAMNCRGGWEYMTMYNGTITEKPNHRIDLTDDEFGSLGKNEFSMLEQRHDDKYFPNQ